MLQLSCKECGHAAHTTILLNFMLSDLLVKCIIPNLPGTSQPISSKAESEWEIAGHIASPGVKGEQGTSSNFILCETGFQKLDICLRTSSYHYWYEGNAVMLERRSEPWREI